MSLPSRDIPVFDGDPLQYKTFMRAFEHSVESKASKADCLYFLEQFTRGQPRELVRSCQHVIPNRGYDLAKELLQEHFGNQYKIGAAYIEKALAWPAVKAEDVGALQAFSLFLRSCCNVMEEFQYVQELDMPTNMRAIMTKFPFKYREKWRTHAHEILERCNRRACFKDLVSFIERQVKIISDPLFGDIQDTATGSPVLKSVNKFKPHSKFSKVRGNSFAAVTVVDAGKGHGTACSAPQRSDSKGSIREACVCCSQSHKLEECPKLKEKKHRDKIDFLKEKGMCFGCLCSGHMSKNCDRRLTCKECGQSHPTVLHISGKTRTSTGSEHTKGTAHVNQPVSETCGHTGAGQEDSILSILPVQIKSIRGSKIIQTYAFLDPGSTATFCSEHLMQRLNITGRKASFLLRTMGQEKVVPTSALNGLEVAGLGSNSFYSLPEVLTQDKMPVTTSNIVTQEELQKWPYLFDVQIPCIDADVDLLIGTNAPKVLEPWEVINSKEDGPYAIRTVLGWVVNGPLRDGENSMPETGFSVAAVNRISVCKLEEMLSNQYSHDFNERSSEEQGASREDMRFLKVMDESAQLQDGHYSLKIPFRKDQFTLPNNLSMVKQRLMGLKGKFRKDELFHKEYTSFFSDVIKNGYAEKVPQHQLEGEHGKLWYIPHHGVRHPKKGTLRVVFDCSAEFKGTSLNSQLLQGPNLTSSLLGVLTRFRQEPVAVMGDIKSMFYQVRVAEEDKNFLRFLWWPEGDVSREPEEFRMTVHLFGAVSSPSCASYALRRTAQDNQANFSLEVVETVRRNFYVDDCLKSLRSEEEAVAMVQSLTEICQRGGFTLTKWISNSRIVLQTIEEEHRATDWKELDLDRDELPVERALGLQWCVESDTFKFKMAMKEQPQSRRGMLSVISSVYDPLGFLAPVTLPAKVMLQELCRRHCGWDDDIPVEIGRQWKRWLEDLKGLTAFKVERCIKPKDFGQPIKAQLHNFSDASQDGFGTVTYLRIENSEGVHVSFLLGKARVTPLKPVTIPRLELAAAVLAVRVDRMLRAELELPLDQSTFWTDSTAVLKYIKNEDKRFHIFVANRVITIRDATQVSQWRYVNTNDNPADFASRGMKVGDLLNGGVWIEGPKFLLGPEKDWPVDITEVAIADDDLEVKREATVNTIIAQGSQTATDQLLSYFSDWRKLKVAVAWFLKWKRILFQLKQKRKELHALDLHRKETDGSALNVSLEMEMVKRATESQMLSAEDLMDAEMAIIHYSQQKRFKEEIAALSAGISVSKNSSVYKLDPCLQDGLLRVGGRLSKAALPEETKHPLILSKDQYISTLILKHIHQQVGHSGRNHTLAKLRNRFWITNSNAAVRKIISQCNFCRRYKGRVGEQKMADLPKERLLPDLPPFTNVGVDYFGPLEVKRGRSLCKRYGVIFTCLASRAIHLEVAPSLDTDACINAIRRFISRRGQVSTMRSDNGTNFVGAEKELREALSLLNHKLIQGVLLQDGSQWSFNPPSASHHGGVWERVIRMVRKVLTSVLRLQTLDDDGLHTVLCEVESILNGRPLTKLSDDPTDLEPLTPNHILLMKGKPVMSPGLFNKDDVYVKRRWRQVQYIADLFWKRWVQEYLPLLQERQKWNQKRRNFIPGDIVMVMDAAAPRGSWLLGRILETFPDKKGFVRSVRLQTKTNVLERPISKLCLLQEATSN